jgi:crossover junction endodeoxyribonuclease RusA
VGAVEFDLPWPPSVNNYYRHVGPRVLISRAGRKYRMMVVSRLTGSHKLVGRLSLSLECYPPDRRRRDLDNLLKACQDALVHAGVMEDDSQIRRLQMEMLEPIEGGLVHVRLETLPERRGQSRVRPPSE